MRWDVLPRNLMGRDAGAPSLGVIDAVIMPGAEREGTRRALGVVGDVGGVGREERLVMLVDAGGDVRPPEKSLHVGGAVVDARLELEQGTTGMKTNAVHALHARHRVVLRKPGRDGAVFRFFKVHVGRHES